ncbi:MAG TPA: GPMC system family 4 glycosyltransferase [Geobacterales bacterium]|nr:GPMC system family 4 glycosyltransferase [Geobacterales bacterium]
MERESTNHQQTKQRPPLRVAMVTPYYLPTLRGNAMTVHRLLQYIGRRGVELKVFSLDALAPESIVTEMTAWQPQLIHAFHGFLGGATARRIAAELKIPFLITLTGTDIYECLNDMRRSETLAAIAEATGVVAFHRSVLEELAHHDPFQGGRGLVIPQGVEIPSEPCTGAGGFPFSPGKCTFLLPAGLRPVKNVLFPLLPLAELFAEDDRLRFLLVGPVLDPSYASQVMSELTRYPFAHYLGGVGHDSLICLYRKADVVLNTSLAEGGMANTVLEAMACGRPVLAADIAGNRSLVTNGVTGFLYRDAEEFVQRGRELMHDAELRLKMGEEGRRLIAEQYAPEKEAAAYWQIYQRMVSGG